VVKIRGDKREKLPIVRWNIGLKGRSFSGSVDSQLKFGSGSMSAYAERLGSAFVGGKVSSIFGCVSQLGTINWY